MLLFIYFIPIFECVPWVTLCLDVDVVGGMPEGLSWKSSKTLHKRGLQVCDVTGASHWLSGLARQAPMLFESRAHHYNVDWTTIKTFSHYLLILPYTDFVCNKKKQRFVTYSIIIFTTVFKNPQNSCWAVKCSPVNQIIREWEKKTLFSAVQHAQACKASTLKIILCKEKKQHLPAPIHHIGTLKSAASVLLCLCVPFLSPFTNIVSLAETRSPFCLKRAKTNLIQNKERFSRVWKTSTQDQWILYHWVCRSWNMDSE